MRSQLANTSAAVFQFIAEFLLNYRERTKLLRILYHFTSYRKKAYIKDFDKVIVCLLIYKTHHYM